MSLGLTLLLNAAGTALDRLWTLRLGRDAAVLLPDYLDPGLLPPLEGTASAEEAATRATLLQIGAQMRAVGLAALGQAVLQASLSDRRRAALLALAGSAPWQAVAGDAGLRCRQAADGTTYLLACRTGGGAAHAPHALQDQSQALWLLDGAAAVAEPAGPASLTRVNGADCLSLDAALRDVALGLQAAGQPQLAAAVVALGGCASLAWPQPALWASEQDTAAPAAA